MTDRDRRELDPDWDRIEALFDQALDRSPAEWDRWLAALDDKPAVVAEVRALLQAGRRRGILDESPALGVSTPAAAEAIQSRLAGALAGRYRIDRVLGHGGMASVFLAREAKHDRSVVLKVLRPEVARWVGPDRFEREIRILARLSHPHIVGLIDSGAAAGLLYYVMPYLGGETLRERLTRGQLPNDEAIPILRDVAAALGYAHGQGLIHRDLKPDNILIVDGHAFLMDFGVAKLVTPDLAPNTSWEGVAIGTPAYMAPEQAAGEAIDARVDVYAWGLVARETLAGPSVPLAAAIATAVARNPADRPRDGAALLAALDDVDLGPRPSRRRTVAAAVGLVAVAAVGAAWFLRDSGPRLEDVAGPVAVAPFRNETGDSTLGVWGRLAGDWLTQGLQETGRARVVPWPVALEASRREATSPVQAVADETGAGTVVSGAYYLVGDRVRFQAQFTDVATGVTLASVPEVLAPRDSIDRGVQALRERVMGVLAIRTDRRVAGMVGEGDRPPTYEAYRLFERGIDAHLHQNYREAAADLIEAWRRDTVFIASLVYASRALWNNGERRRADSVIQAIRARPAALSPYHELLVSYVEKVLAGDGVGALEAIREAASQAPDGRADYNVAHAALAIGRPADAIAALQGVNPDRGPMKGWAPYWYTLVHALHLEGRRQEEAAAVAELRRRHPDSRASWVHLTRLHAAAGDRARIDSVMTEAASLPPDTYWSQAAMLVTAGEELTAHGHPGGRGYLLRAVDWLANQLARDPQHRAHRYWMGTAQYDLGAFQDAEPYFESLARDDSTEVLYRGYLGLIATRAGDTALARRRLGPEPPYDRGEYLAYLARFAGIRGEVERSVSLWSEALARGVNGLVWIHPAAHSELAAVREDPRFRRLGIVPK